MTELKVLCFNVWGIHYLAKRIRERLGYIADHLHPYDIVGLQEVWSTKDYKFLVERLESHFPYHHHTHRGILGTGLCVFSRYPITSSHTHLFSVNGSILELGDGEVFAGKCIMSCFIDTPSGPIAVYNAHTNPRNRESQMFEIFQFVEASRGSLPVILLGDFNTKPRHMAYGVLTDCLRLVDVFTADPTDTCDLKSNIYTETHMTPKRIDFILYSDLESPSYELELKSHQLALTGHIPGKSFPFSDHEGVESVFKLRPRDNPAPTPSRKLSPEAIQIFQQLAETMETQRSKFRTTPPRVVATFVLLLMTCLLAVVPLSNSALFMWLAQFYMSWCLVTVMGLLSAGSMVVAVYLFSCVSVLNNLGANITEIQTLLNYQRTLKD